MKSVLVGCVAMGVWVLQAGVVLAQSTLDALAEELKEVKQQHDDVTAQNLSTFFAQIDKAMASPDAAVELWQQAGGRCPSPCPG